MNGYNGFKKNFITKKIKIGEFMTEQDIQAVLGTHYGCGCRAIVEVGKGLIQSVGGKI